MEKQYYSAPPGSDISELAQKQTYGIRISLLKSEVPSVFKYHKECRHFEDLYSDTGVEIPPTVSHILLRIWTKVIKTEMSEGKAFICFPDFERAFFFSFITLSSTEDSITSGVLLKDCMVKICQHSWFYAASKKYILTSF